MTTLAALAVSLLVSSQVDAGVEASIGETPRDNYILSARGPQEGDGVVAAGGALMFVFPSIDVRWMYAVSSGFQTDLQLKTLGILTQADLTVRFRVIGNEYFSLAVRGGSILQGIVFESSDDSITGMNASGGGGVVISFGPEWLQWTVINEGYVGYATGSGREVVSLNNALGVEFPVADTRNMFIEARAVTLFHPGQDPVPLPILSLGCAW